MTRIFLIPLMVGILLLQMDHSLAGMKRAADGLDTLYVYELDDLPQMDGLGNDECWEKRSWHAIDQVWMPWGEQVDSIDFYGHFKLAWSAQQNLLYVLLEIQDDVASDNYLPGETAPIYNFDMFEVFIDEDRSGGLHVFDGADSIRSRYGANAENAFGYHICTNFADAPDSLDRYFIEDLTGCCWQSVIHCDYRDHFPEFCFQREGNITRWEFSLIVYDDSYDIAAKENIPVKLTNNKVMGFSMAYNDDDDDAGSNPENVLRDNFFGSVAVPEETWNDHWRNADPFGVLKLVGPIQETVP